MDNINKIIILKSLDKDKLEELYENGFKITDTKDYQDFVNLIFMHIIMRFIEKTDQALDDLKYSISLLIEMDFKFIIDEWHYLVLTNEKYIKYDKQIVIKCFDDLIYFLAENNSMLFDEKTLYYLIMLDVSVKTIGKVIDDGCTMNDNMIYLAIEKNNCQLVELLIDKGINFTMWRHCICPVKSPLKYAESLGHKDICTLLKMAENKIKYI